MKYYKISKKTFETILGGEDKNKPRSSIFSKIDKVCETSTFYVFS